MMKMLKKLSLAPLLAVLLMLMARLALAGDEPFTLDETAVLNGMPCSWAQGYEPVISGGVMTLHFPLCAPANVEKVTVTFRLRVREAVSRSVVENIREL